MNRIVIILLVLLIGTGIANAQDKIKFASARTTDTAYTIGSLRVDSTLRFVKYRSADSNKVLGVDAGGLIVLRTKGTASASTDSLQTVIDRGKNSTKGIRFGSGANTQSVTIDSVDMRSTATSTLYSIFGVSGVSSIQGTTQRSFGAGGYVRLNNSTGIYNTLDFANPTISNKTITIQDKTGTVALLSDITDTIANRVATKSDTVWGAGSLRLVTESDMNTIGATRVNLNGNTVGGTMVYGVIDSYNRVEQNFNTFDTVYARGTHTYNGKWSEVVASFYNNNTTTGARQSNGINIVIGTGTVAPSNTPAITFGAPNSSNSKRISADGLTGYSNINISSTSTAGTTIIPAFSGSNTGDAITLALGSYTGSNNTPNAGNLNMFRVGTGYLSTGGWSPSTGSANLRLIQGAIKVSATSTYSGTVKFVTDDSMSLSLANGYYIAYEANQNVGWGFKQNRTGAKNAFAGRTTIGDTVDNGTDQLQVYNGSINIATAGGKIKIATGSNASVGGGTFSGGAVTISTTAVTASSRIFIQYTSCSNCGTTYISAKVAGTSFTVTSSNGSDASTFDYWIIN